MWSAFFCAFNFKIDINLIIKNTRLSKSERNHIMGWINLNNVKTY